MTVKKFFTQIATTLELSNLPLTPSKTKSPSESKNRPTSVSGLVFAISKKLSIAGSPTATRKETAPTGSGKQEEKEELSISAACFPTVTVL